HRLRQPRRRARDPARGPDRGRRRARGVRGPRRQGGARAGDHRLRRRRLHRGARGPGAGRARGDRGQGGAARRRRGAGDRRRAGAGRRLRQRRRRRPGRRRPAMSGRQGEGMEPVDGTVRADGLVGFSVRRRVTVAMVTVSLLLFGLIALGNLKVNLLPDISYPTLTVRTEYTGAAPQEIETLVSEPVEEALGVVKGVRKLRSVSRTGQSDVVLEFAWGTDMDQASLEVRDKMEALQLPMDVDPPVLLRFNPSTEPVLRLALAGSAGGSEGALTGLRRYADEDLKKKLEPVAGVAAVKVAGGYE